MYLFCNSYLVENITNTENNMTVQGNGVTLAVTHRATFLGYKQDVWFIKGDITNTTAIKNLIKNIKQHMIAPIKYSWCIGRMKKNQTWN